MAHKRTKWGDREARRRDILSAARAQLEQRGYLGLNMREVAKRAGVSPGTLYTYFKTKEEIFATLYAQRLDAYLDEIAPLCANATRLEDLFVGVAATYIDVYRSYGQNLNLWTLVREEGALDDFSAELGQALIDATTRVQVMVGGALGRVADIESVELVKSELAMPFLWSALNGLADHFTGERHLIHPYTWQEMVGFAARVLVTALTAGAGEPGGSRSRKLTV